MCKEERDFKLDDNEIIELQEMTEGLLTNVYFNNLNCYETIDEKIEALNDALEVLESNPELSEIFYHAIINGTKKTIELIEEEKKNFNNNVLEFKKEEA